MLSQPPSLFLRQPQIRRLVDRKTIDQIRPAIPRARDWQEEPVQDGDSGWSADLSSYSLFRGWRLWVARSSMLLAHRHGWGDPYGERIIVVTGNLQDVDGAGQTVELVSGQQIVHAPDTIHQPLVDEACVFLMHRPAGLLPLFSFLSPGGE